ncbi:ABC transporter substrate-binding protein [Williamsia soli]|uniref:ABC transporter substrate-binding protein n=1 Tax=Williamsia soli TaxID=364929 RepID=UPI001A9F3687|nr:ABC transporter substrate-binding protein [Williamsia soli]
MVAAASMVLAGCGSDSESSGGDRPSASSNLTGEPIKVMTIASGTGQLDPHPEILKTAEMYGDWINENGGIGGRPLEVITCDNADDPNKDAACARKAVDEGVVATVGSYTLNGESVIPVLEQANTSSFGICCAIVASELDSPVVQQLGAGLAMQSGMGVKAAADGCKNTVWIGSDAGDTTDLQVKLAEGGLKSMGAAPLKEVVRIPLKAQDYSAQVTQALDGSDCLISPIPEASLAPFLSAFASQGGDQRIYGLQGLLTENVAKQFSQQTDGAVVTGMYQDLSTPAYADLRAAIKQYKPDSDLVFNSIGALGAWAAYDEFTSVVEGITGPLDHNTFLAAAQKHVSTFPGVAPGVDFAKSYDGLGGAFKNQVNRSITYSVIKDGKITPFADGAFYDMTAPMAGTPIPAASTPPKGD